MNVRVTSVSKKEQQLFGTPSAVFVLTNEAIRPEEIKRASSELRQRYGAPDLPDKPSDQSRVGGFFDWRDGSAVLVDVREASGQTAANGEQFLAQIRHQIQREAIEKTIEMRIEAITRDTGLDAARSARAMDPAGEYHLRARALVREVHEPDWSQIDARVAQQMVKAGRSHDDVAEAIRDASPNEAAVSTLSYGEQTASAARTIVDQERAYQQERSLIDRADDRTNDRGR